MTSTGGRREVVFVSYSHKDTAWLERLQVFLKGLERQGMKARAWHDHLIEAGDIWRDEILAALDAATVAVLLVSQDFLVSDFIRKIEIPTILKAREVRRLVVLPVILKPCAYDQDHDLEQFQAINTPSNPLSGMNDHEREAAWVKVAEAIVAALNPEQADPAIPAPGDHPADLVNVPPSNRLFTGREDVLEQLGNALNERRRAALSGMPGVGKTQTAIAYAHGHRKEYQHVFWFNADTPASLVTGYCSLARALALPEKDETEQSRVVQAVLRWLKNQTGWLLVLDNADDLEAIKALIPDDGAGHLLVTTRQPALRGLGIEPVPVEKMSVDAGARLILRRAGLPADEASLESARAISREVDGLPLALDQAGAFIEEMQVSPAEYLDLFRAKTRDLLKVRGTLGGEDHASVTTTFQLVFDRLSEASPAAADLLRFCVFLAHEAIPENILIKGAPDLGESLGGVLTDPLTRLPTVMAVARMGLIKRDPSGTSLIVHRLVQMVLYEEMDPQLRALWIERAVRALVRAFPAVEFPNWAEIDRLLPHSIECGRRGIETRVATTEAARLLHECAYYLLFRGDYNKSELLFNECLREQEPTLGPDHADTLITRSRLALLTSIKGKPTDALAILEELIPRMECVLGHDHRETMKAYSTAARCRGDAGEPEEARRLLRELQGRQEVALGPLHPDTLITRNDFAFWTGFTGRLDEALELFDQLLTDVTRVRGPNHPDTLTVQDDLALWTARAGKFGEAYQLFSKSLPLVEQFMGRNHPLALRTKLNLEYNKVRQGQLDEALLQRVHSVMEDVERVLGDHPDVFTTRSYIALWTHELGRRDEAFRLFRELLPACERALGSDHPVTLTTLLSLAKTMLDSELHEERRLVLRDGLSRASKRHGADSSLARRFLDLLGDDPGAHG